MSDAVEQVKARIADIEADVKGIRVSMEHLVESADRVQDLLIGDGSDLSLSAKVHILWRSTTVLVGAVGTLAAERLYHLFFRAGGQ